jgi:hypothetical protein
LACMEQSRIELPLAAGQGTVNSHKDLGRLLGAVKASEQTIARRGPDGLYRA